MPGESLAQQHVMRVGAAVGCERIGIFVEQFHEFADAVTGHSARLGQMNQFAVRAE